MERTTSLSCAPRWFRRNLTPTPRHRLHARPRLPARIMGRRASAGLGCSSAFSTSICSIAQTVAASSRSLPPSAQQRRSSAASIICIWPPEFHRVHRRGCRRSCRRPGKPPCDDLAGVSRPSQLGQQTRSAAGPEVPAQPQIGVCGDGPLAGHDVTDTLRWYADVLGQTVLRQAQRRQKL